MHSSPSKRGRVSVVVVSEMRTSRLPFATGATEGLDSGRSAETMSEGRGSIETTDVVPPCKQASCDAAPKAVTLQAHVPRFSLTFSGSSDVRRGLSHPTRRQDGNLSVAAFKDEEFCADDGESSALTEETLFLTSMERAFKHALSAIGMSVFVSVSTFDSSFVLQRERHQATRLSTTRRAALSMRSMERAPSAPRTTHFPVCGTCGKPTSSQTGPPAASIRCSLFTSERQVSHRAGRTVQNLVPVRH